MGTGTGAGTGRERELEREWRLVDEHKIGTRTEAGTETRAVAEMGKGTRTGTGTGMKTRSERVEERRRSAKTSTRVVDTIRRFPSTRVIISADRGWSLRAPDSSIHKARCLYTRIAPRG